MFQGISHDRLLLQCERGGHKPPRDAPTQSDLGRNFAPEEFEKKSPPAAEPPDGTNVRRVAPGEAPQPLTLNHPA